MAYRIAPACRGASALGLALALLFCGGAARANSSRLTPWTGPAPAFSLPDSRGEARALAADPAPLTIVHFFATWCEPCREELPALTRLARRAGQKVRVIAISVAEPEMRVRRFLATTETGFPVLMDRDRAVVRGWGVATLPTSFVLDRNLSPLLKAEDSVDWDGFDIGQVSKSSRTSAEARQ